MGGQESSQETDKFVIDDYAMDSDTATESNHSLKSRSFLNRVNDRLRKKLDLSSKDAMQYICLLHWKHMYSWERITQKMNIPSKNSGKDLTMKQMFDMSEKLIVGQPDVIYGVKTINWDDSSWKYLSLIGDEQVISLQRTKVHVFSDSVLCLGKMNENPQSNIAWEDRLTWFKKFTTIQYYGHN